MMRQYKKGYMKQDTVENPLLHLRRPDLPGRFNEATMLLEQKERLRAIDSGLVVPPYEVIIHPAAACNLGCEWCIGARIMDKSIVVDTSQRLKGTMTVPKNMEKVIRDLVEYERHGFKIKNISFSGITGEPMIAKKAFMGAVDILKAHGVRVGIFSNSSLIDDDLIQTLLKIDYINISLDAAKAETYARLKYGGLPKGEAIFNQIIANIGKLVKARNESGSQLAINASVILHPDNYTEIYEAARMLKELGVDTLRMKQDISGRRILTHDQLREANVLVQQTQALQGDGFNFLQVHPISRPPVMERTFKKCRITELWGAIGSDGNVYPCNYTALAGVVPYGNAIEQPFSEIWEGDTRMQRREKLPEGCPPMCDPFKTRANIVLEAVALSRELHGDEATDAFIEELATGSIMK